MSETLSFLAQLVGPLLGAGAGSYFGLKSAINGLRATADRTERAVDDVRDRIIKLEVRAEDCGKQP